MAKLKNLSIAALAPGRYVLAVSGGVDSMVLLDLLSRQRGLELFVAHFDHGIRPDSSQDSKLVQDAAAEYGLEYETGFGRLGASASEEQARKARYEFLHRASKQHKAKSIVTAHHQDDLLETAVLNVIRGSGPAGLVAIQSNPNITRPLIKVPKVEILAYAKESGIKWREDSTNNDTSYLRNYVRLRIMPKLSEVEKRDLLNNIDKVAENNVELNELIATLSRTMELNNSIDRSKYLSVPRPLDAELMVFWLRQNKVELDRKTVNRLQIGLKTAKSGTILDVSGDLRLKIGTTDAHFSNR